MDAEKRLSGSEGGSKETSEEAAGKISPRDYNAGVPNPWAPV